MTTIDTPLVMFESPAMRLGRTTFVPNNEHIFPVVSQNYWLTNFPQTKAAKFSVHHTVAFEQGSSSLLEKLHPSLWVFPST